MVVEAVRAHVTRLDDVRVLFFVRDRLGVSKSILGPSTQVGAVVLVSRRRSSAGEAVAIRVPARCFGDALVGSWKTGVLVKCTGDVSH